MKIISFKTKSFQPLPIKERSILGHHHKTICDDLVGFLQSQGIDSYCKDNSLNHNIIIPSIHARIEMFVIEAFNSYFEVRIRVLGDNESEDITKKVTAWGNKIHE